MKVKGKNSVNNFRVFNATLVETNGKLKVVGVYGANTLDDLLGETNTRRLDARNFARSLRDAELVTH